MGLTIDLRLTILRSVFYLGEMRKTIFRTFELAKLGGYTLSLCIFEVGCT